ncbi:MAG: hypothetical protein HDQ88_07000 [Clostridia bacterium]|nr:hypothetical protein [Clostridia bacterium]
MRLREQQCNQFPERAEVFARDFYVFIFSARSGSFLYWVYGAIDNTGGQRVLFIFEVRLFLCALFIPERAMRSGSSWRIFIVQKFICLLFIGKTKGAGRFCAKVYLFIFVYLFIKKTKGAPIFWRELMVQLFICLFLEKNTSPPPAVPADAGKK